MARRFICPRCEHGNTSGSPIIYTTNLGHCPNCNCFLEDYIPGRSYGRKVSSKQAATPITASVSTTQGTVAAAQNNSKVSNSGTVTAANSTQNSSSTKTKVTPVKKTGAAPVSVVTTTPNKPSGVTATPNKSSGATATANKPTAVVNNSNSSTSGSSLTATRQRKPLVEEVFENHGIVGLSIPKKKIEMLYSEWNTENFKSSINRKAEIDRTIGKFNFLISGQECSGKTEISKVITEILGKSGIRSNTEPEWIRLKDFEAAMQKDEDLKTLFDPLSGKTVIIEEQLDEAFMNAKGEVEKDNNKLNDILHALRFLDGNVTLIFELSKELNNILMMNTRMNDSFYTVELGEYTQDELYTLALKRIEKEFHYTLNDEAKVQLKNRIKRTSFDGYSQGRFILDVLQDAQNKMVERLASGSSKAVSDQYTFVKSDFEYHTFRQDEALKILKEIDSRTGQDEVKKYAHKMYDLAVENEKRNNAGKEPKKEEQANFVLEGEPGTGKTTSCYTLAKLLWACGFLSFKEPKIVGISDLQKSAVGGTPDQVRQVFHQARGRMLVIDEAYTLAPSGNGVNGNYGQEVVDTITAELGKPGKDIIVVLVGYKGSMVPVIKMNEGMPRRFPKTIVLEPYSDDELVDIFYSHAKKCGYTVEEDARELVKQLIENRKRVENFGNAGGVITIVEEVINSNNNPNDIITKADVLNAVGLNSFANNNPIGALDGMIGISEVKKYMKDEAKVLEGERKMKKMGMEVEGKSTYNMTFVGPPGTGKTTVARIVAKLYSDMGITKYADRIIEVNGADFIGSYIGHSEEKTKKIFKEAEGGVLYIDEIYMIDNKTSFGDAAINCFLTETEARGNELIVIISGYEDKVNEFLAKNPGLRSRFPETNTLHFNDYSEDELLEIFEYSLKSKKREYDKKADTIAQVRTWIKKQIGKPGFGNARDIRILADACIDNMKKRIAEMQTFEKKDTVITFCDVPTPI